MTTLVIILITKKFRNTKPTMNQFWNNNKPHILAALLFVVLSALYFTPVFKGYTLQQGDIMSWVGMAKEVLDYNELHDDQTLWTGSMFSGMPTYQIHMAQQGNLLAKVNLLMKVFPRPPYYFLLLMVGFYVLAQSLRVRPMLATLGAIAFGFSSFFIISIEAGHNAKIFATCYMPFMLAATVYAYRGKQLLGMVLLGVTMSLQLKANHLQITYYTAGIMAVFAIYYLIESYKSSQLPAFVKASGFLIVGVVLAVGSNATHLITTAEYAKSTIRGKSELTIEANGANNMTNKSGGLDRDYITNWSLDKAETWALLFPNVKGGASGRLASEEGAMKAVSPQYRQMVGGQNTYWGNQPFVSGPVYAGAIICLLFILALIFSKNKLKWAILAITTVSIMIAWGRNLMWFTDLFIDYMPMFNKFRTVTMIMIVVELMLPLLAVIYLEELIEKKEELKQNWKKLAGAGASIAVVLMLFAVAPSTFFDFFSDREKAQFEMQKDQNPAQAGQIDLVLNELQSAREAMFTSDAWRSVGLVLLAMVVLIGVIQGRIKTQVGVYILIGAVTLDLWTVDKRYLNNEKSGSRYVSWIKKQEVRKPFPMETFDQQILEMEKQMNPNLSNLIAQRVSEIEDIKGERFSTRDRQIAQFTALKELTHYRIFDLKSNTFNSARSAYYHKTIGGYHAAKLMRYQELIDFYLNRSTGNVDPEVLNMLNMKYMVTPQGEVQYNSSAFGNAWFVNRVTQVADADEEIQALGDLNPLSEAIVDTRFSDILKPGEYSSSNSTIQLLSYSPKELLYQSQSASGGVAVFSEVYYQPGWQCYIDGEKVEHARVNYILRAVEVPAGEHEIEFVFEPSSASTGEGISYASSIALILLALGMIAGKIRDKE